MAERHQVTLARHGETEWSANGRHTGVTDLDLTEAGRAQAAALAARLDGRHFALVLTSPRRRAIETCRLAGLGQSALVDPDLAEWDYGVYEGLSSPEIDALHPGWSLWRDGCPGGEQAVDVGQRADRVIARCRAAGGDVVLFAHGHLLRVLAARWIGVGPERGRSFVLGTGSVSELGWDRVTAAVVGWNASG